MTAVFAFTPSPLGDLCLIRGDDGLRGLYMTGHRGGPEIDPAWRRDQTAFADVTAQLDAYFAGELKSFDLPLAPRGTAFQLRVWEALTDIPFGATTSYGRLAARIGRPTASRAVGLANGRNPISLIVPCHRVIGANGSLTGYGGGLDRKSRLLRHEAATVARGDGAAQLRLAPGAAGSRPAEALPLAAANGACAPAFPGSA